MTQNAEIHPKPQNLNRREKERQERVSKLGSRALASTNLGHPDVMSIVSRRLTEVPDRCIEAGMALKSLSLRVNDIETVPIALCAKCLYLEQV
jgi:hypothetical protein